MKAPLLALSIAAASFAGSSVYFWQQLQAERQRSAQAEQASRQLNERIAVLEKTRGQSTLVRSVNNGPVMSGVFGAVAPPAAAAASQVAAPGKGEPGWNADLPHERPPAMDKMMRWQVRAGHKRMYAGVREALGLSKEQTAQLIDLLTEHQVAQMDSFTDLPWSTDPREAQRRAEEQKRQNEAAIQELLGAEKALALQEYQQSMPARQEFEMLVNQLEGNDVTLSPDQNSKLLAVFLEERKRVPMPTYDELTDPVAYRETYNTWQDDYWNRVSDEARHILDSGQISAFNEVQQWQKDMRTQFSSVTFATSGPAQAGVAVAGNAVSFTAAPVAVSAGVPMTLVAPAPPKKPTERRD